MREILFRGKHKSCGKWCEGNLHIDKQSVAIITPDNTPLGCYGQVDPATVGQFTGFTDKNGRKAFEGDCINHHFGPEIGIIRYGQYRNTFNDDQFAAHIGFYVEWKGPQANSLRKDLGFWLSLDGVSVIGNIHDNPELLKGGAPGGV